MIQTLRTYLLMAAFGIALGGLGIDLVLHAIRG